MTIPEASLEEFISIYEQIYGDRLSHEEARPMATKLVDLFRLITRPLSEEFDSRGRTAREAA